MGLFAALHESGCGTKLLNARALVCPEELAKADMRPFRRDSAFDPERSLQLRRSIDIPALPNVTTACSAGGIVPFTRQPSHREGHYASHHRTAGIGSRSRHRGGLAARGSGAAAEGATAGFDPRLCKNALLKVILTI
jgi:hypothetical protein